MRYYVKSKRGKLMTKFVVDSSSDMTNYKGINLTVVPMNISTKERTFTDDELLDVSEMLDYMQGYKDRSFTACPGTQSWLEAYEGGDVIYVATLTSALSGTYNSALIAQDIYLEEHPEAKIHVFDSLTTGPELRLLVEKLMELDASGLDFDEVVREAEGYTARTRLFFVFSSLHNLAQNGRVNKAVAATIGAFNIRIVGTASESGEIQPIAKRKGDNHAASEILHQLEEIGFADGKIRICHVNNRELAHKYVQVLHNKYPEADIKAYASRGLVSYYAERGGILVAVEI